MESADKLKEIDAKNYIRYIININDLDQNT